MMELQRKTVDSVLGCTYLGSVLFPTNLCTNSTIPYIDVQDTDAKNLI